MLFLFALSCKSPSKENDAKIKRITLDPGHFHAALVQKSMYPDVDSTVYVYAEPSLYILPSVSPANQFAYEQALNDKMNAIKARYPGIELKKIDKSWEVHEGN